MASTGSSRENATSKVLRVVSVPDAFLFFIDVERYTGEFATSLPDLLRKLDRVPLQSVEFHFQRSDFEKWVGRTIGDQELAGKLHQVDRLVRGEELRVAVRNAIQKRLEEFGQAV
jgi:hypothetical protein